jgi:hypothetical protein
MNLDEIPPYTTWTGAFDHVYTSSLGELSTDTYYNDSMQPVLVILFIFMSFFMTIHMLNMLIAMMGESFGKNNEEGEAKKKMSQLEFVVNNWYFDPIKNKERVVYIISAKSLMFDDESDHRLDAIEGRLDLLHIQQENMLHEIKGVVQRLTVMGSHSNV